jgi:hypothetical protein
MVVLGISAFASVGLYILYVKDTRELRNLQAQLSFIANRQAASGALVKDCIDYSAKNSDIDPLLKAFGFPTAAPATKPAPK